jgi:putative ABC transport system permease protein
VIGQIAVALVLLAGAGLFLRSLAAALSLNPGFETGRIATTTIALAPYGYTPDRANRFFDDLHARLIRNPAIQSVSFGTQYGGMTPRGQVFINGEPRKFPSTVVYIAADEHYFRTIGLPLLQGRDFTPADRGGAPHVGIVSASFGRLLAHGGDPLGYQVKLASERAPTEVVGVVPDVITSVSVLEPLRLYRPQSQISNLGLATFRGVVVRATRDGADAIQDTLRTIHEIDSAIVPPAMTSMDEQMASQMRPQQFGATVLGALGVIAVILTLFGAYVLAESTAALRAREMGIRAALGAGAGQLGALMVADTAKLIGLGLAVGLVLVWLGADLIRALLFRVEPLDPTTLGAVAGLILVLGLVVSARPALRAARVDLARVLREG